MAIWPISYFQKRAAVREAAGALLRARTGNSLQPQLPAGETGVTGTVNTLGYLQTENNPDLAHELGYGRLQTWGEYEEMSRTDPEVSSAIDMTLAPIKDATIEVKPPDEEDDQQVAISEFIRDNFTKWLEPGWSELAEQIGSTFLVNGFNLHEPVFGVRDDKRVPGGKGFYLQKLAQRLPASLLSNPWMEKDGELVTIRQQGYRDGNYAQVDLPADRVLLWSWKRTGQNYAGYSHLRPGWYLYKIRREVLKVLGIGSVREGLGIPIANVERDAPVSGDQLKDLRLFLENMTAHENAALVSLPGVEIEWLWSPTTNKGHLVDTYNALGLVIQQLFFSQGNKLGTNGTGSRAVGSVHADTQFRFTQSVASFMEGPFNGVGARPYTGLIKRLVDANWGPQDAYPTFHITLKKPDLPVSDFSSGLEQLVSAGVITVTDTLENEAREKLGVSAITPEERKAEQQKKHEQALALTQAQPEPFGGDKKDAKPAKARLLASMGPDDAFRPTRLMRDSEKHLAVEDMHDFLNTARADFERDVKDIGANMVRRALPAVKKALKDGDPSDVADIELDDSGLSSYVRGYVEKARAFGAKQVRAERKRQPADLLSKRRKGDQTLAPTPLKASAEEEEKDPAPSEIDRRDVVDRTEKLVEAQTELVTNRITNRVKQELQRESIGLVNRGGPIGDIVDRVAADLVEGKQLRNDAGIVLTRSFNLGREEAAAEFGDEIAEVERSAILDQNTCGVCVAKDGKTADFNSPEHDQLMPPDPECDGGDQCRCLFVYLFKGGPGFSRVEDGE